MGKQSLAILSKDLISIYHDLFGEDWIRKKLNLSSELEKRLNLLQRICAVSDPRELLLDERNKFLEILLSTYALVAASKGNGFILDSKHLLGKRNDLRGNFNKKNENKSNEDEINRRFFSYSIQGWYQGVSGEDLRDLEYDKSFSGRVCDYKILDNEGTSHLIECKKIDTGYSTLQNIDLKKIASKIVWEIIPGATQQLISTAKQINKKVTKSIFIDVTNYGKNNQIELDDKNGTILIGFSERDIELIRSEIISEIQNNDMIDQVILCWNNFINIESYPRAIIQKSVTISLTDKECPRYLGWSVEIYPKNSIRGIDELRIAKKSWSWERIATSFANCSSPSTFLTISDVEKR